MNTTPSNLENQTAVEAPIFDPFPEPRAYPSGWDLSALPAARSAVELAEDATEG